MIKETEPNSNTSLTHFKNELWGLLHNKNEISLGIGSEEYYVILYFLLLQRESVLSPSLSRNISETRYTINNISDKFLDDREVFFGLLQREFAPIINRINYNAVKSIVLLFETLDQSIFKEHFSEIFDDFLFKYSKLNSRNIAGSILPAELSKFICGLVELPGNARVYNPFAGLASFIISLSKDFHCSGQEINQTISTIGLMRLMAYDKFLNNVFIQDDSIKNWNFYEEKNDLIISSPPFGMRLTNSLPGKFGNIINYEHFLIEKSLDDLNETGMVIAVLSQGFLSRSGSERGLREHLIENDLLDIVISFPGGMLMNTTIPVSIVVINKNKKQKGLVRFLDASKFVVSKSVREKVLNYGALNEAIKGRVDSPSLRIASNSKVSEFDFNFNSQRYFETEIDIEENTDLVKLSELIGSFRGQRITKVQSGKFVRIRNLKETKLDFSLDLMNLEKIELPRHVLKISESCLLLATRWSTLKPTYFNFIDESIFISPDIAAFKVDENLVDINYLINELNAQYVLDQANVFRTGLVVSSLRKDDILNIKIKVVKLNEQKAKVKGLLENFAEQKKKELVIFNKIHGLESTIIEQNAYLRHSLAGASTNITGAVTSLMNIINEQIKPLVPEVLNFKESPVHTLNLNRLMDILKENADKVFKTTSRVTNNTDPTSEVDFLSCINIYDFLNRYCLEKKAIGSQQYQLAFEYDEKAFKDENGNLIDTYISANKNLLTIMLDNLLQNAEQHAFPGYLNNRIEIALLCQSNENNINRITILVSNTGKPMPEDYLLSDFIRNGSTAGYNGGNGYGGWLINRIITFFNGELDIINEQAAGGLPDTDLVTSFEINLPITEVTIL